MPRGHAPADGRQGRAASRSSPRTRPMPRRCAGSCSAGSRRSKTTSRPFASVASTRSRASAGTSAGVTSKTERAPPSSSTGGRASRPRSTGPRWPIRSVWSAGAGSCSARASSPTSSRRTSPIPTRSRARAGFPIRCSPSSDGRGRGRSRDIVATIQAEQDAVIRAPIETCLVVQGGPGTGKTAVGLHRAAFLLYEHRARLAREGVLVVGPNPVFLRYISQVLPSLGETSATQTTVDGLLALRFRIVGEDPLAVAAIKGDARLAEVIARGAIDAIRVPTAGLTVRFRTRAADARRRRRTRARRRRAPAATRPSRPNVSDSASRWYDARTTGTRAALRSSSTSTTSASRCSPTRSRARRSTAAGAV